VPSIDVESFSGVNANEWLIKHALFSREGIPFSAANVSKEEAEVLQCAASQAVLVIDNSLEHRTIRHIGKISLRFWLS